MSAGQWLMWTVIGKVISFSKRTSVNIWHLQCSQQANSRQCTLPSHTTIGQVDSAQSTTGDTVASTAKIHSISQGEHEDEEESHSQDESSQIIPRQAGNLAREVIPGPTWQDADKCEVNLVTVPGALNYNSARGTEHCKCQGHLTLNSARGTVHLWCHGHIGQLWQTGTVFGCGQVR